MEKSIIIPNNIVVLLLGGNVGDRLSMIEDATDLIALKIGIIIKESNIYETASWGREDLPAHLNKALIVETKYGAHKVLELALSIEQQLGRTRHEKWGLRSIDIDLIYFNDDVIQTHNLIIPHSLMHERRFVLTPLVEIMPKYVHPLLNKRNDILLSEVNDPLRVEQFDTNKVLVNG